MAIVDRPTELSEQVLEAVKKGQQGALDAVRVFSEAIDSALPLHGDGPSKRAEVVDSALAMADRLVQTQYDFLKSVIGSAGGALGAARPQQRQEVPPAAQPEAAQTEAAEPEAAQPEE